MTKRSECFCQCHNPPIGMEIVHCAPCCEPDGPFRPLSGVTERQEPKQIAEYDENEQHHWSGWPGAMCLKCFGGDPIEQAFAEGNFTEVADDSEMGFHYEFPNVPTPPCPVKGVLQWNSARASWDIKLPDGTIEHAYKDNMGQPK